MSEVAGAFSRPDCRLRLDMTGGVSGADCPEVKDDWPIW